MTTYDARMQIKKDKFQYRSAADDEKRQIFFYLLNRLSHDIATAISGMYIVNGATCRLDFSPFIEKDEGDILVLELHANIEVFPLDKNNQS